MTESDSVIFIQTPLYMEWQVIGDVQHTYRITYPNSVSSNTDLKAIYINQAVYADFDPQVRQYVYRTDNPVHIHAVANDEASLLTVSYTAQGENSIFTYTVTAEDGTVG